MNAVVDNIDEVLRAFGYTVLAFLFSAVFSLILGAVLVAMRVGPIAVLSKTAALYVTLVRNTPLVMLFIFFHFAGPKIGITFKWAAFELAGVHFNTALITAIVALSLYTSTFICEALRSGVNSVPLGQAEAARSIGLPFAGVMTQVILPQAIRASVPPVASTLIAMLKNTSVAAAFFLVEAVATMKVLGNNHSDQRWGIFICFALGYVILVEIVSLASQALERRWRIA